LISSHFRDSVGGPEKADVGGSIPSLAANNFNNLETRAEAIPFTNVFVEEKEPLSNQSESFQDGITAEKRLASLICSCHRPSLKTLSGS
jgi:hypothetical protein